MLYSKASLERLHQELSAAKAVNTTMIARLDGAHTRERASAAAADNAEAAAKEVATRFAARSALPSRILTLTPADSRLCGTQTQIGGKGDDTSQAGRALRLAARACALGVREGRATAGHYATHAAEIALAKAKMAMIGAVEAAEAEASVRAARTQALAESAEGKAMISAMRAAKSATTIDESIARCAEQEEKTKAAAVELENTVLAAPAVAVRVPEDSEVANGVHEILADLTVGDRIRDGVKTVVGVAAKVRNAFSGSHSRNGEVVGDAGSRQGATGGSGDCP